MKDDYGLAYVGNIRKPICGARQIKRGKNKGKYTVTLCRGRDAKGKVVPGDKAIVPAKSLIKMPPKKEVKAK